MQRPLLISLALAAGLIAPVTAQTPFVPPTPAAPGAPARPTTHVGGRVTAVTGSAITVAGRRGAPPTTFTLAPDARIHLVTPLQVSDLAVGNVVRVDGQVSDDGKTVDATSHRATRRSPPRPDQAG